MIVRKVKKNNYTSIINTLLQNKKLSFKARGLMGLFLSLPNNWDFNKKGIASFTTDGRESIDNAIKELKKQKYITIQKILPTKENPKIDYLWTIYEDPYQDTGFQDTDYQDTDYQDTENQQLQNNNIQINNKQKNNIQNKVSKKESEPTFNEIIDNLIVDTELNAEIKEWVKSRLLRKDRLTNHAIELACKKVLKMPQEKQLKSVQEAIIRGWKGIFEVSDDNLKDKTREAYIKDVALKEKKEKGFIGKLENINNKANKMQDFLGGKLNDTRRSELITQNDKCLLPNKENT